MRRIAALSLGIAVACGAHAQSLPPGPKVTVTAVTQVSPTVPQYTKVEIPLLREGVPKQTNGRIEFNLASWPEKNVNGPEVIRLVRSGQVDIGGAPLTTVSGDVPLLDGFDLAGLNPTIDQAKKIADALMPLANQQLEKLGVKLLGTYPYPAQVFFCKKPIKGLEDVKGLKIRVNGPSAGDLVGHFGAQATAMAFGEVYTALERGTVDCAITGTTSGNSVKWYEVTGTLYTLPAGWSTSGYFVNLAWWNKQDPAVRAYLEKVFLDLQEQQWKLGGEATQDGINCNTGRQPCTLVTLVKDKPMTEVKPTAAELEAVRKGFAAAVLPTWVKRCGTQCGELYNSVVAPISGVKFGG
jgi:TRAP-type C4-dicarboxylate transport system substrate-binding protein